MKEDTITHLTYVTYISDGIQTDYPVPMEYIKRDYVKVYRQEPSDHGFYLGDLIPAEFEWINDGMIRLLPAPPLDNRIVIRRETYADMPLVDFQDAAILLESDLDLATLQALHVAQEANEGINRAMDLTFTTELLQMREILEQIQDAQAAFADASQGGMGGPVGTAYFVSDGVSTTFTLARPKVGRYVVLMAFEASTRRVVHFAETTAVDGGIALGMAEPLPYGTKIGVTFLRSVNTEEDPVPTEYVFTLTTPATAWTIGHTLGSNYPRILTFSDAGDVIVGGVDWSQADQKVVTINFSSPVAGKAILSI